MNKNNFTFGRRQHKIQMKANLPIIITVVGVVALIYGVVNLVISQIKPEATPISTITVTKNVPSASELNLSAPLVDYNPNKEEQKKDEEKKKADAEKKDKEKDEDKKDDTVANEPSPSVEVLGAQAQSQAMLNIIMPIFGATAAKSTKKVETQTPANNAVNTDTNNTSQDNSTQDNN